MPSFPARLIAAPRRLALLTLVLLLAAGWQPAEAQRPMQYRSLLMQSQMQPLYFDYFTLPADSGAPLTFHAIFKLPYSTLPFRKAAEGDSTASFFSTAQLSIEIFHGTAEDLHEPREVEVDGREAVGRAAWTDTARVTTYERTQSRDHFLEGSLTVGLEPGVYVYVVQLSRGGDTEGITSRARAVQVRPYDDQRHGDILFGKRVNGESLRLLNIGNSVPYAEDFDALVHLPGHGEGDRYAVHVQRLRVQDEDTTAEATVWESNLDASQLADDRNPVFDSEAISVRLAPGGGTYALLGVPNSRFPNDWYRMTVTRGEDGPVVARRTYRSLWRNMPAALYNLEIAVDMLRFIADESTVRDIRRGSQAEIERKFRNFWEERDPTPDTEFNELMAEYYRRVDHAFREFTTEETPGYETDQGRIYIQYGEPRKVERTYPAGEPTTEIWIYEQRRFVFQATSGYGDFQLVNG
ncbi:MAG: GWxTD domain-containing protein [Balneolaceae bacterium]|nr:GWxTD domain-containing protein [Balneolaceae bacterium]